MNYFADVALLFIVKHISKLNSSHLFSDLIGKCDMIQQYPSSTPCLPQVVDPSGSNESRKLIFICSWILLHRRPAELLNINSVLQDNVAVIRRFSGGGTVIVDHGTVFVTFICNKDALLDVQPYPRPIMSWSSLVYKEVFQEIGDFSLRENGTTNIWFDLI